ncbi:MAG: hypothetical protein AMJ81_03530 [Phycisphaerae bacterium SM23_33]|jgi:predicted nucleotidyltransferase|nr:MAG: hypothetical protein AMJ81_03530 [Phycisphaerae bacterium SM23_33]
MHDYHDPEVAAALEKFLGPISDFFGPRLVSVILYGSIVFDDLAPGYGDLDFLAVTEADLSPQTQRRLAALRRPLRRERASTIEKMIEGAFLPRHMLDPARKGRAYWWGTNGERPWEASQLGWMVLHVIRRRGRVIHGRDVCDEIPIPSREMIVEELRAFPRTAPDNCRSALGDVHAVDFLLTAARLLLWLREDRLSSKSEAADWGFRNAEGPWRQLLPRARHLRLHPAEAELPRHRRWLRTLEASTRAACEEVARWLDAGPG